MKGIENAISGVPDNFLAYTTKPVCGPVRTRLVYDIVWRALEEFTPLVKCSDLSATRRLCQYVTECACQPRPPSRPLLSHTKVSPFEGPSLPPGTCKAKMGPIDWFLSPVPAPINGVLSFWVIFGPPGVAVLTPR